MEDKTRKIFNSDDDILRRMRDVTANQEITEKAVGTPNDYMKTFYSSTEFFPNTLKVYLDGNLQVEGVDYSITTSTSFTFVTAPAQYSTLSIKYSPV